jgi:putative hemolysin
VNCAQWGGTTVNRNGDRGETRYCSFADGRVSEEWALLRDKQCKPPE